MKATNRLAPAAAKTAPTSASKATSKAAPKTPPKRRTGADPAVRGAPASPASPAKAVVAPPAGEWPLWEVFVRSRAGLDHKHCGSLHAADPAMAMQMAREVYTRRQEGVSLWVVRSAHIVASDPGDRDMLFDPMEDKVYRHPSFYKLPAEVDQM